MERFYRLYLFPYDESDACNGWTCDSLNSIFVEFATSQVFSLCEVSARAEVCVIGWGGGQFRRYLSAGAAADTAVVFLLFVPCRVGRGVI